MDVASPQLSRKVQNISELQRSLYQATSNKHLLVS